MKPFFFGQIVKAAIGPATPTLSLGGPAPAAAPVTSGTNAYRPGVSAGRGGAPSQPAQPNMLQRVLAQGGGNGWKAPGNPGAPAMGPSNTPPGATPINPNAQGGGGGVMGAINRMLPTPTAPYAAGGMGGVASTGAGTQKPLSLEEAGRQINATRQRYSRGDGAVAPTPKRLEIAPQTRIKDDPTFRMPKEVNHTAQSTWSAKKPPINATPAAVTQSAPAPMHPSDQAKMIRDQMNQRRRDAAFGRGTFGKDEEAKMMAQHEALIAQSNKMRNDPNYKPNPASTNPRDQADALRMQLNRDRSAAGGEVPQAGRVMNQVNQLSRQWDNMPAGKVPGATPINPRVQPGQPMPAGPRPAAPSGLPAPMIAKTSAALTPFEFGQRLKEAFVFMGPGALAGMATAPAGQQDLAIGRGALRGAGTGLGVGTGAVAGGVGGAGLGAGLGALLGAMSNMRKPYSGVPMSLGERMGAGASAGIPVGALAGIVPGAIYGGYKGNMATKALLDKSAPLDDEPKKEKKEPKKEPKKEHDSDDDE